MNEGEIYNFIKNRVSKEKLESWTNTLRGFNPRKRDEMLRRFSDRLPALKEINDFIENIVNEFNIHRDLVSEQLRKLQEEYNIGINFNAAKVSAIKQIIKYSSETGERQVPEAKIPLEHRKVRDLTEISTELKRELKEIASSLNMEQIEEYQVSGGSVDVVWLKKLEGDQNVPIVGIEIETSWRTRKHIKGDIFNLTVLKPILGVILFIKKGFGDEKKYSGNVKATKKYVREWRKNCPIIVLNEEQIRAIKELIV